VFLIVHYWKQPEKRKLALILFPCSVIFFILLFSVIIPAFEDESKKYALFDFTAVGATPSQALAFMISHPLKAIRLLFVNHSDTDYHNGIKQNFYVVYMVSGGLLLFLRPWFLIPFIPILAKKMYDDNPLRWSIETYYSVEFVSIMPPLIFMILANWRSLPLKRSVGGALCVITALMTGYKMLVPPPNPIVGESNKYNIIHPDFYKPEYHISEVNAVIKKIPGNASVSGSGRLLPHLAYREKVYYFPIVKDADYIIVFKRNDYYPLMKDDYEKAVASYESNADWRLLENTEDVLLFKRIHAAQKL